MSAAELSLCRALELERKALDFYEAARGQSHSELGARVFELLAQDKQRLATRLAEIAAAVSQGMTLARACALIEDGENGGPARFETLAAPHGAGRASETDLGLIAAALEIEQECLEHLERMLQAEDDPGVRSVLQRTLEDEKGHFVLISDMRYHFEGSLEASNGR